MAIALAVDIRGCGPGTRQTKVCNLEDAIERDEDVSGFEVEMNVTIVVNMANALYSLAYCCL